MSVKKMLLATVTATALMAPVQVTQAVAYADGPIASVASKKKPARPAPRASRYQDSGARMWARYPTWIRQFGYCVRRHESVSAGGYRAHNPRSSASGAHQWLRGTWAIASREAGLSGWSQAMYAPPSVQDAVFAAWVKRHGGSAWRGCGCGHGS